MSPSACVLPPPLNARVSYTHIKQHTNVWKRSAGNIVGVPQGEVYILLYSWLCNFVVYVGHPLNLYFGSSGVLLGARREKTGKVFHFYPGKRLWEYTVSFLPWITSLGISSYIFTLENVFGNIQFHFYPGKCLWEYPVSFFTLENIFGNIQFHFYPGKRLWEYPVSFLPWKTSLGISSFIFTLENFFGNIHFRGISKRNLGNISKTRFQAHRSRESQWSGTGSTLWLRTLLLSVVWFQGYAGTVFI